MSRTQWFYAALLCWAFSAQAEDKQKLLIYTEDFPPYNFVEDDKVVGISIDIVKLLCQATQVKCEFILQPWSRAYTNTLNKTNAGLVTISRHAKRESQFQWVGPLVSSQAYLYRLTERNDINIHSYQDALKYTVGIPRNDVYETILLSKGFIKGVNLLDFSYKQEMNELFFKGKLDLIVGSAFTQPYQLLASKQNSAAVMTPALEFEVPELQGNHLAFNLKVDPKLVAAMQSTLNSLVKQGLIQPIIAQYIALGEHRLDAH
ncbi:substrate-binding periplasmic protein [Paraglaciecola hydrolytica]|uniref:Solute-binding protein family 3/N-terminal domain-containing protein n=1 Tax=Paraglaciecola hydrolytica TaxID=1799789 RepID=A0A148KLB8_9ALTE|nr:transporter substrate-binding domain-containing protein [Paraglaciecola hydrolytica]KXI27114.1 hypothetical protein AX660_01635 [Paraglaciecola hydrolytica]